MNIKFLVTLIALTLTTNSVVGASKAPTKRGIQEYGPPIRISSSVLTFQQNEGSLHDETNTAGRLLKGESSRLQVERDNHSPQNFDAVRSGYLKFLGVVGSGNIYIPEDDTEHHFGNINDRLQGPLKWS